MIPTADRLVVVPAGRLDDLLELVRLASDRLGGEDQLALALRAVASDIRVSQLLEP